MLACADGNWFYLQYRVPVKTLKWRRIKSVWGPRRKWVFEQTLKWRKIVVAFSVHESAEIRKFGRVYFKLIVFQTDHVSLTSDGSYRCDSCCLARIFQNLPAPPQHYGVFYVFAGFQSFFQPENLGSHLAMSSDDRFLPQGKQNLPKICQVGPMPNTGQSSIRIMRDLWCDTPRDRITNNSYRQSSYFLSAPQPCSR